MHRRNIDCRCAAAGSVNPSFELGHLPAMRRRPHPELSPADASSLSPHAAVFVILETGSPSFSLSLPSPGHCRLGFRGGSFDRARAGGWPAWRALRVASVDYNADTASDVQGRGYTQMRIFPMPKPDDAAHRDAGQGIDSRWPAELYRSPPTTGGLTCLQSAF